MSKLSKIGLGILVGYLLSQTLTEEDFEGFKKTLLQKTNKIEPKLSQYFYELNNIVNNTDLDLDKNTKDKKIVLKLSEIKEELEKVKSEEVANMIVSDLNKEKNNHHE